MRPLWLVPLFLIAAAMNAEACSCAWAGRPCRAFEETPVVFSGRVVEIGTVKTDKGYEERLVRFEILQAFKGVSGSHVEVVTGLGGADCGYSFRRGGEYMVYAHPWEAQKRLYTGICSRTRRLSEAEEDLDYFRRKDDPKLGAGIVGQVEKLRRTSKDGTMTEWDGWLKNAPLAVLREAQRWETTTNSRGEFAIWGLTPGTYRLEVQAPPGYVGGTIEKVEIKAGHACAEQRVLVLPEWKPAAR